MARLRWTPQAIEDIESICSYIARDSDYFARVFAQQIMEKMSVLESFSGAGRMVPESHREDIREILHGNYRIIYRVLDDVVEILTVYHSARNLDLTDIDRER